MSSDYRLGPRGCQRGADANIIAVLSEFAEANESRRTPASKRLRGFVRAYTKIRMRLHFYSAKTNQIGLQNKFANVALNCFPRERRRV
jgi:hypothetical protein